MHLRIAFESRAQGRVETSPCAPALHAATMGALTRQTPVDCSGNGLRKRGCRGLPALLNQVAELRRLRALHAWRRFLSAPLNHQRGAQAQEGAGGCARRQPYMCHRRAPPLSNVTALRRLGLETRHFDSAPSVSLNSAPCQGLVVCPPPPPRFPAS